MDVSLRVGVVEFGFEDEPESESDEELFLVRPTPRPTPRAIAITAATARMLYKMRFLCILRPPTGAASTY